MMNEPIVAICMITYNHEEYITQAIEGVLKQKTTFGILLVIGEDCSTDSTRKICEYYANVYPNAIHLLLSEQNLGMNRNGIRTLEACINTGAKYIALCEGDDYWTDPYKLQKQVDFLEANPDYSFCFHNVDVSYDGIDLGTQNLKNIENREYSGLEILKEWIVPTCSVCYKSNFNGKKFVMEKNKDFYFGDLILFLSLAEYGKIRGMSDNMAVYRRNPQSITIRNSGLEKAKKFCLHHVAISQSFNDKYSEFYKKRIYDYYYSWFLQCILERKFDDFFFLLKKLNFRILYYSFKTLIKYLRK